MAPSYAWPVPYVKKPLRLFLLSLVTTLMMLGGGCGGSSTRGEEGDNHSPDELTAVYTSYFEALLRPDPGRVCSLLTTKAQRQLIRDLNSGDMTVDGDKPTTCSAAVMTTYALMKAFSATPELTETVASVNGDNGTVRWSTKSSYGSENGLAQLVYEGDHWLIDRDGSGGDEASRKAEAKADISRWLSSWCDLKPGMTKAEAIAKMGEPTSSYDAIEAIPQLSWERGAYHFTAFMNTDNVLDQLQADYSHLGKRDRARLSCAETRR